LVSEDFIPIFDLSLSIGANAGFFFSFFVYETFMLSKE